MLGPRFSLLDFAITPLDLDGACIWCQRKLRKQRKENEGQPLKVHIRYAHCAGSPREMWIAIVWDGMSSPFCTFCFERTDARFRVGLVLGWVQRSVSCTCCGVCCCRCLGSLCAVPRIVSCPVRFGSVGGQAYRPTTRPRDYRYGSALLLRREALLQ